MLAVQTSASIIVDGTINVLGMSVTIPTGHPLITQGAVISVVSYTDSYWNSIVSTDNLASLVTTVSFTDNTGAKLAWNDPANPLTFTTGLKVPAATATTAYQGV